MKEAIFAFLIALAIGSVINAYSGGTSTPPPGEVAHQQGDGTSAKETTSGGAASETSDANFDNDVLNSKEAVVVDFYSNNCPPCLKMAPVFSQLAEDNVGKVKFVRLDVEQNPSVAARYSVNAIPTFIIFKAGQRVESFTGLVSKDILAQAVNKAI